MLPLYSKVSQRHYVDEIEKVTIMNKRLLQKQQTKIKILQAARVIFLSHGFQDTTITLIGEQAGIGYGTVYGHFKNKETIFSELIEQTMHDFFIVANEPFHPKNAAQATAIIHTQVYRFLTLARVHKKTLQLIEEAMGYSALIRLKWSTIVQQFTHRIAQDLTYAQQQNLLKYPIDVTIIATSWFGINETFLWRIVADDTLCIDTITQQITQFYVSALYQ